MLMRFEPFQDFDRLFERAPERTRARTMPLDAYRKENEFRVEVDLPGVNSESIEVTVDKNVLTVKAERQCSVAQSEIVVHERPQGSFTRQLFLGDALVGDKLQARYRDGVLHLSIPVAEEGKPRRIEVTSFSGAEAISTASAA